MEHAVTPPRLEGCYFPRPGTELMWERLARVLEATAAEQCPGWQVRVAKIPAAAGSTAASNTAKLEHWRRVVQETADGDRVLLIDADTMILRPLDAVWDQPFDVAYTTKTKKFPFNAGVMFVRVSPQTKAFMAAWAEENRQMLADSTRHQPWKATYGGINQAALGRLLSEGRVANLATAALPCLEWNCEDTSWASFDPAVTRILHIKSLLRVSALSRSRPVPELAPLVERWRDADRQARPEARSA